MIWLNGKYVKKTKAHISPFDRGFLFGEGVFETLRAYNGVPFAYKEHMKRFEKGCKLLSIPIEYSRNEILNIIKKLLTINGLNLKSAYIRITATRGITESLRDLESKKTTLMIFCKEIDEDALSEKRSKGVVLETVDFERGYLAEIKHTSYLISSFAITKILKKNKDVYEALFMDSQKHILEGATSNIFFYRDNEIVTPPKGKILEGVMRNHVINVLKEKGFLVSEKNIHYDEIKDWQGAFITNSLIEMLPVSKIDRISFSTTGFDRLYKEVKETFF
jgi:branched-subunit amino acid aminotransferase/4-amino-4-deoxychorismate lyase